MTGQSGPVDDAREESLSGLCRPGGVAAGLLFVYSLATMVQLAVLGGQPGTAAEAFRLLHEDRVVGLLRLDLPTVLALPLYYVLFLGLFAALRRADPPRTTLATVLAFAGLTLVLATPTGLSMLPLADRYAAATTVEARAPSWARSSSRARPFSCPSSCCARGSSAGPRRGSAS